MKQKINMVASATKYLFIISASLFAHLHAHAVSFDCAKSSTNIEKAICSTGYLGELDDKLDHLYATLRNHLDSNRSSALLASQRRWIKDRNSRCGEAKDQAVCLKALYMNRIDALQTQISELLLPQQVVFLPLSGKKKEAILALPKSYGFPQGEAVLKNALYYELNENIDLIDVSYAPPIIAGLYKVDYKMGTAKRISSNLSSRGTDSIRLDKQVVFVTGNSFVRHGRVSESISLLVVGPNKIYERLVYSGQYIYSEASKEPLCTRKSDPEISISDKIAKQLVDYKLSSDNEFTFRLTFEATDCVTGKTETVEQILKKSDLDKPALREVQKTHQS
ncbi:lysozyme inhibitor LprI family protein [Microbulbifer hainanensis]|uniref:lysozyme inhibitor LprI family protein n=1 Tax=Microbulbifer hainanensis TaxID=2735675 RepID=UPI001865F2BD|nr:lysozyme inhibitor LprI family protein [Microbulbifer hainanensis]